MTRAADIGDYGTVLTDMSTLIAALAPSDQTQTNYADQNNDYTQLALEWDKMQNMIVGLINKYVTS